MSLKVLGLCGSVRECSLSRRVLDEALRIAQAEGGDATCFNFRENALPLYDEDVLNESGVPSEVEELKMAVKEADVILLATPEYNSSITPLMKNAIDWVSISHDSSQFGNEWDGKVVCLIACSPGKLGGVRCLSHLRDVITNVSALSAPQQAAVGGAKLDEAGNLIADERSLNILSGAVNAALSLARCRA